MLDIRVQVPEAGGGSDLRAQWESKLQVGPDVIRLNRGLTIGPWWLFVTDEPSFFETACCNLYCRQSKN